MKMNKEINTNVGILIFLVTASLLVLLDFLIIHAELDKGRVVSNVDNAKSVIVD